MQYDQNNGRIEGCSSFQMTGYVVGADYQTSEWKLIGKRTETACPVDRNIRGMDTSGILTAICTRPARDRYNARTHLLQSSVPCCGGVSYSLTKKGGFSSSIMQERFPSIPRCERYSVLVCRLARGSIAMRRIG